MNKKMEAKGIDMSAQWFWIDIFCLDQQHPDKMETIKRSNEIYALAKYYFVIGLACFNRLWCTMELACKLGGQNGVDTDVVVTDFDGLLKRREEAYMLTQLRKDPTFEQRLLTAPTCPHCLPVRLDGPISTGPARATSLPTELLRK